MRGLGSLLYHHLRGTLIEVGSLGLIVETGGVGWQLRVPLSTSEALCREVGEEVLLFTHLLVREDDLQLFGFATRGERQVFRLLLSVSRTGPSIALQALSACGAADLVAALRDGDTGVLCRIKGVGKKLAERLVLELREKATVVALEIRDARGGGAGGSSAASMGGAGRADAVHAAIDQATIALSELGFVARDARRRAEDASAALASEQREVGVEALIREALHRA